MAGRSAYAGRTAPDRDHRAARIGAGVAKTTAGFVLLSLHRYGWAALFLVAGMVAYMFGYWEMSIARSGPARL